MPSPIAVAGVSSADGLILSSLQTLVEIDGDPIAVNGSPIADHGDDEHDNAVTANGSSLFHINGIPVNRNGDAASCGDVITGGVSWFESD